MAVYDSFTKWIEAIVMKSKAAGPIVEDLRELFARFEWGGHKIADCGHCRPDLRSPKSKIRDKRFVPIDGLTIS